MDIEDHVQDLAKQLVGNWKKFESFGWHDRPEDCDCWCVIYTHTRDSGLIAQSNAHVFKETLSPFLAQARNREDADIQEEHHGHWGVGWMDGYSIRVFKNGEITKAFRAYAKLKLRLDDYPLLDENDYSDREYQASIQAIEGWSHLVKTDVKAFDDSNSWASKVFSWLCENDESELENRDDQGAYPSEDAIKSALKALDMLDPEDE